MTNHVAASAQTLLPSGELYRKAVRRDLWISGTVFVVVVGIQIPLQWARASISGSAGAYALIWLYVAGLVLGVGLSIWLYRAVLKNSRIDLGATALDTTNLFGRTRTVPFANVGTVIQTLVRLPAVTLPMLFLLDGNGKRMLTMYGTLWPTDSMIAVGAAVTADTGVAPTVFPAAVSYRELRKLYPNAVSWARANPILLAGIIAGSVFLGLIVFLVVLFAGLFSAA